MSEAQLGDAACRALARRNDSRTAAVAALAGVVDQVAHWVPSVAGGNNMALIEAAYAVGLWPVHTRSEAGAGFVANGIAWETGLPTLCLVITSVGVYGLLQALYVASVNRRPVVIVSGEVSGTGCGSVQAGDGWDGPSVTLVTRPLTAWSVDATSVECAVRGLQRAVRIAREARRPAHVNIPLKVQKELTR